MVVGIKNFNLFICSTPLQMIIAEKIIITNRLPSEKNIIIVLHANSNEKYLNYANRLKKLAFEMFYFSMDFGSSRIKKLKHHYKIKNFLKCNFSNENSYDVYFANINDMTISQLCTMINVNRVFTFDDGIGNVNKKSIYFRDEKNSIQNKILRWIMGIKEKQITLKGKIFKHYTIYDGLDNIVKKEKLIPLSIWPFDSDLNKTKGVREIKKIFLGQPFNELGVEEQIIIKNIKSLGIEYYFPHPREKNKIHNVNYINTSMIFEEYIYNEIIENTDTSYEIYSIISSALLNINELSLTERLSVCYLYTDDIKKQYSDVYELFDKMNIYSIKIR
ncbi:glycosyltransferase family 52 [Pectobacterium fontis]|uniref:Uncharacterized protein n=1 Tax=Pectobacterium fontis TaxID=2558042 RepID=A0A7V8IL82_9GAMM|nr:glycosyltransferase family 52 [Pectobacterium fontis]KHN54689.1 hypothetical protein OI69_03285 [Pectobacterium fontis]